ncbi:MAG TPA: ABC transporter permease [Pyrinomonadaceae bacterium]|nr:ABC transporter permease [Pyrinomonadaceae bacterium]
MRNIWQDFRFAGRVLSKNPGFTAVAVLTLALGIGINTAIFSVVNAILLRPLSYPDPEQLVLLNHNYPKIDLKASVSAPGYKHYRENAKSFEGIAAMSFWSANLTGDGGEPERLQGMTTSANLFPLLRAEAERGRVLLPEEEEKGRDRVAVITDGLWRRRFGSDPNLVGKRVSLNGESYEIVGIMPPDFQFGREIGLTIEIWSPLTFTPQQLSMDNIGRENLFVLTRLKPGVSFEQAQAEMNAIADSLRAQLMPGLTVNDWGLKLTEMSETVVGEVRPMLWMLLGAVGLVLLIACANVANLLLARSAVRQKEIAIRTALGAGRGRVIRQLLTESVLLAVVGGALGLLLATWGVDLLLSFNESKIPRAYEVGVDLWVLGFTVGVSLLTGVLFGLAPALQASKVDLHDALKEGGRSGAGGMKKGARSALVVAEMALALVLLICAGLLIKSFAQLQQVNPGFRPEGILSMQLTLPEAKYKEPPQRQEFFRQLIERVRALPGVEAAGATNVLPLSGQNQSGSFGIEGRPVPQGQTSPHGDRWMVTADYFRTMSIPLVRGRYFTEQDGPDAPGVAILDETMARKYWPNEDPVGKRISFETGPDNNPRWREVVGIVGHVRHKDLEGESRVQYYVPLVQRPNPGIFLAVRTLGEPEALTASVRGVIRELDRDLPVYKVTTMEQLVSDSMAQRRFSMLMLGIFAVVALLLASVGLYGVLAYSVTQRTREIGVRMALGAQTRDVLKMVVGQGMVLALAGVGVGLVGAFAVTRLMSSLLYGVTATDPLVFAAVALLLTAVAFLACYIPARRATRVDPMVALRYE